MLLKDVMTHNVAVASPDETIEQAAREMKEWDVGSLPICEGDRVVGMLTDRDIVVRSTAAGCDPKAARVRDVMTTDVVSCCEDEDVRGVPALMTAKRIRRLLVLSRANSLVGIASRGDLAAEAARRLLALSRADGLVGMGMGATPGRRAPPGEPPPAAGNLGVKITEFLFGPDPEPEPGNGNGTVR